MAKRFRFILTDVVRWSAIDSVRARRSDPSTCYGRASELGEPARRDSNEAIAWAKQIGSGDKVAAKENDRVRWAVERRIHALIGVAAGIHDSSKRQ